MSLPAFYSFDGLDPLDRTNGYDSIKSFVDRFYTRVSMFHWSHGVL